MKRLLLILNVLIMVCANASWAACGYEDVVVADDRWAAAVDSGVPEAVAALYTEHAVLLPTFDVRILTTPEARLKYFEDLHKKIHHLRVEYKGRKHIKINDDGGGAVSSGFYIFTGFVMNDWGYWEEVVTPARYTFVYKDDNHYGCQLALVTHHSSELPEPEFEGLISK